MPRLSNGRRYEQWSNSHVVPTDWNGRGQPTQHRVEPPTEWTVLLYPMDPCQRHEVRRFSSREEVAAFLETL